APAARLSLPVPSEHASHRPLTPHAGGLQAAAGLAGQLSAAPVALPPAGLDAVGHGQSRVDVLGEDERRETEVGIVGHVDDLVDVLPRNHGQDGTEDLLTAGLPVVLRLREGDGSMVEAGLADFEGVGAVVGDLHSGHRLAELDVAGHLVVLLLVDDAADVGGLIAWVADLHLRYGVDELAQEVVVDVLVEEQSRTHGARLSLTG